MISSTDFSIAIVGLILASALLLYFGVRLCRRGAAFRCLLVLNYMVTQPISGIAHLSQWGTSRGYFDLLAFPSEHLTQSALAAVTGAIALLIGAGTRTPIETKSGEVISFSRPERRIVMLLVLVLGPASLYGLIQMNSIASSIGSARIIELDGGAARFSFLSHWFAFVATTAAIFAAGKIGPKNPWVVLAALGAGFILIMLALTWSGGRSIVIVMALPLLYYSIPKLKALRWPVILCGGAAFLIYVVVVSQTRSDRLTAGAGVNLGNWLDWEWGRFSMTGLAVESASRIGLLWGETFASAFNFTLLPLFNFLGLEAPRLMTPMDVASRVTVGDFSLIYMVPGFTSELMMNFGLIGVIVGYFILGRATRVLDFAIQKSTSLLSRLFLFYVGALLVFRVLPSGSVAFLVYLTYSGTPYLISISMLKLRNWLAAGTGRGVHKHA